MAKRRKKSPTLYIFLFILIAILCSYAIRYIFFKIDTEIIKYGTMENSFKTKGLIIRNEWVYNFSSEVELKNKVPEGQRVPYGKKVVEIVKGDYMEEDLLPKINKLDERINEIIANEAEEDIFDKDIEKLDRSIDSKIELIKSYSMEGDLENLTDIKNKLSADLYKKSLIAGSNSFSGKNLEQLQREKNQLEDLYNNNLDAIYAKCSGVVSYRLDGLEQSLNPINIDKMNIEDVKEIIALSEEDKSVPENHEGLKVIESYTWNICCIVNEEQIKDLKEGNRIKLLFQDDESQLVSAKIIRISEPSEGDYLVALEVNEYIKDYYRIRTADLTIVTRQFEGFMVPSSCIAESNSQKGIFIVKKGIIRFVPAEILAFDDNMTLITNIEYEEDDNQAVRYIIKVYDEAIRNTRKIKEDQKVM